MRQRVVVYGLGRKFIEYREKIETEYEVAAYCDRNVSVGKDLPCRISVESLKDCVAEYDRILVTTKRGDVIHDLHVNFGVPMEKIKLYPMDTPSCTMGGDFPSLASYSQRGEDLVLLGLIKLIYGSVSLCRYLEIGTNHPIYWSNSFLLYQNGARGALVDPLPWVKDAVALCRPDDMFVQAAVTGSAKGDMATFYMSEVDSPISSLHCDWARDVSAVSSATVKIQVSLLGIETLLNKLDFEPNLLLIDAEGEDLDIIKGLIGTSFRPGIIMSELDEQQDFLRACCLLETAGYVLLGNNGLNPIFISGSIYDNLKETISK